MYYFFPILPYPGQAIYPHFQSQTGLIRIFMCWDGEVREIGFVDVGRQEKWRAMR